MTKTAVAEVQANLPEASAPVDAGTAMISMIERVARDPAIDIAKPGETIEVMTPQFTRTDGLTVPLPVFDFAKLPTLPEDTLKAIGCQKWDDPDKDGNVLWLYPSEWYDHIPDGTIVTDINGGVEPFKRGETDDDMRFGALAYGFMRPTP